MNKLKSILTDTLYVGLGTTILATRTVVKVAKTCRNEGKKYLTMNPIDKAFGRKVTQSEVDDMVENGEITWREV